MKTCKDCTFTCKAADNETCERFKDSSLFGGGFRYKIYQTSSIEVLRDEQPIGVANSYEEAQKIINDYLAVNSFHSDRYWRYCMGETATFIDYGSWTKFIAIVPPISVKELMGED